MEDGDDWLCKNEDLRTKEEEITNTKNKLKKEREK